MKSKESKKVITPGMIKELMKLSFDSVPIKNLSYETAEMYINNDRFRTELSAVYQKYVLPSGQPRLLSEKFYGSSLIIPPLMPSLGYKFISQMSVQEILEQYNNCTQGHKAYKYSDLTSVIFPYFGKMQLGDFNFADKALEIATPAQAARAYEVLNDANFADYFYLLIDKDGYKPCLTLPQVYWFCNKYFNDANFFPADGHGVFFFLEYRQKYYALRVYMEGKKLQSWEDKKLQQPKGLSYKFGLISDPCKWEGDSCNIIIAPAPGLRHGLIDTQPALLGEPTLTKQVILSKDFSLDKNVQPKKEFKYAFVNPDYAKDEYFAKSTLTGLATLTITPTTRATTNQELVEASGQSDALAIANALHNMLIEDAHCLDQYKNTYIVIPVSSIRPDTDGSLFCLDLRWNDGGWNLYYRWLNDKWRAGVYVARLSQ